MKFKKKVKIEFFKELKEKIALVKPILNDQSMDDSISFRISFTTDDRPESWLFRMYTVTARHHYGSVHLVFKIDHVDYNQKDLFSFFEQEIEKKVSNY